MNAKATDAKDLEKSFWDSPELRLYLLDQSLDGILAFDLDCRLTFWNRGMEKITGLARSKALGRNAFELFPYLKETGEDQFFREAIEGKRIDSKDRPFHIAESGQQGFYEASYFPVRSAQNGIVGGMAVVRDITQRKRNEERLRESESRFRTMADSAPVLLWMAGTDARCDFFNKGWLDFTGRKLEEELGDGWAEGVHADDVQRCVNDYMEAFRKRQSFRLEYRLRRHDGKYRWLLDHGAPRYGPSGEFLGYIGSCVDITDMKEAEDSLRKTKEELEGHAEELHQSNADLEQFAYAASHDLKEPLRSIASYAQLLQRRYRGKLDRTADEFISYLVDGAARMENLIDGLLTMAQVRSRGLRLEEVDCEKVLGDTLSNLKEKIEKAGARITHDPLPSLRGDFYLLVQAFQNLIDNAIKFRGVHPPQVHVSAKRDGASWLFSIQDNGIGMDEEHTERVFQVFGRLHSRSDFPGNGIGLATCKRIIERHEGKIWFSSKIGEGSTFFFTLPG